MDILVDYRCRPCESLQERWVPKPVPATVSCFLCGGRASRVFGANVRTSSATDSHPASSRGGATGSFYLDNRDVPGICHMSGSEARRWISLARGDKAGQKRELERQQRAVDAGRIDPGKPSGHTHVSVPTTKEITS